MLLRMSRACNESTGRFRLRGGRTDATVHMGHHRLSGIRRTDGCGTHTSTDVDHYLSAASEFLAEIIR